MYIANLKKLRLARGLRVKEVARALGFSEKTVRRHENIGITRNAITTVCKYADFYNVRLDDLLDRKQEGRT